MKTGLVLEGGAMRGLFSAGVMDIMLENNITFDGACGTSAGAIFGANFKSRQIERSIRYNVRFCKDKRYGSFRSLIKTGDYYGKKFCYETIPNSLDLFDTKTYRENPMRFFICCTDIKKGRPVYFESKKGERFDLEVIRASASMPLFSTIVKIGDRELLDGGITDSIPIKFMERMGFEKNIVILTQPSDFTKKKSNLLPVIKRVYKSYPNMLKAMNKRHIVYNDTINYIKKREEDGSILVLQPNKSLGISRISNDPKELVRVYLLGRSMAYEKLNDIKNFLNS